MHVDNAPFGYQAFDITPTELKVVKEFDALQSINGNIQIIAAGLDAGGKHGLYAATIVQPKLSWDIKAKAVNGWDPKGM